MRTFRGVAYRTGQVFAPVVLAVIVTSILLAVSGAPPLQTLAILLQGGIGSAAKLALSASVWVPLTLCSSALLFTFAAGLWNIGVEGQIILGAIMATGFLRLFPEGGSVLWIGGALLAGMLGGAFWALLSGLLRTWGRVHEIFSGLGLNFVALGLTLYLIFGPWKRPGIASMSGTEPIAPSFWLASYLNLPCSPVSLLLALVCLAVVAVLLGRTRWGLRLKAVGQNPNAALLVGLEPNRRILEAMAVCGAVAGLAGALQVVGVYHRLLPAISSQYGYTALLVAMLASYRVGLIPIICFFFAVLTVGSIQLPLQLQLDSSLSGVIQGCLVLAFFLVQGIEAKLRMQWGRS
ncbi:MAG: ABC transporter permease [Deltaproteobacteria bacterium]|nr:ABC transporter permease [Deltaproteobacteria bacterium]MBW2072434.1 ABC transporter permease [Deltaproteobacteria bacterium]